MDSYVPKNNELSDRFASPLSTPKTSPESSMPVATPLQAPITDKPEPKKRSLDKTALVFVYVFILIISVFSVYIWQNGKANTAQKALTASTVLTDESNNIQKNNFQAVFLNNGQTYFGKITTFNKDYVTLTNIYYLRVNDSAVNQSKSSTASQDSSLVKLGCEVHGPDDKMVINRSELTFWENLKPTGRVATAIAQYVKQNPTVPSCS
jgi:hypothetical protein